MDSSSTLKCASANEDDGGIGGADGEKLMPPWWQKCNDVLRSAFIVELNAGKKNERPLDGCWREFLW